MQQVRRNNTYGAGDLSALTCCRSMTTPGPSFRTRSGLHIGCATLRGLRGQDLGDRRARVQQAGASVSARSRARAGRSPNGPTNAAASAAPSPCSRSRCPPRMGYDKVNDHQQRRRRVHRFTPDMSLRDASEGLRRAHRAADEVHPHRAGPQRSARTDDMKRVDHAGSVLEIHQGEGPRRLPRQTAVGPAQEARPREQSICPSGSSCARWRRRSRSTR